jgi:hypothetical protein
MGAGRLSAVAAETSAENGHETRSTEGEVAAAKKLARLAAASRFALLCTQNMALTLGLHRILTGQLFGRQAKF